MVGKILWGVLLFLLLLILLLVLLLQLPVKARLTYDRGDLSLGVQFAFVKLRLFPKPEKPEKPAEEKKRKPKKKKEEKKKKPKAKINREQIFYALEKLPPILGRALRRTGKSVRIDPLKAWVLVAGADPADTAALYGRLEAALAAGFPLLRQAVSIKNEDIRLYLDFTEEKMDAIADVGVALRPWRLVTVGVRALGSLIKWYLGFRKLASPPPKEEQNDDSRSEEAA